MEKPVKPKAPPIFIVNMMMKFIDFLGKLQRKLMPPQALLIDHAIADIVKNRCVYVAAELKIADYLRDGPKSIKQLAKETGTNADALYRIMRALTSIGIFKEKKNKYFATNKVGKYLQTDIDDTMVFFTRVAGIEWVFRVWGDLLQSVKNGKDYYENNHGEHFFEWLEKRPEEYKKAADIGMTSVSVLSDVPVAAAYDFSSFDSIVDVGGGYGSQIITLVKAFPKLKGALFDLSFPIGMVAIEGVLEKAGVADRIELVDGDFFKSVPAGYDVYFMKSILHDWEDKKALKILANCRKAMRDDSKLLIVENIIKGDRNKPDFAIFLDINLLAQFGGLNRTMNEYAALLEKSGFKLKRTFSTAVPFTLIEAKPI